MNLVDFVKQCGWKIQPWQRPIIEALARGETIRPVTDAERHAAQRGALRRAMDDFRNQLNSVK